MTHFKSNTAAVAILCSLLLLLISQSTGLKSKEECQKEGSPFPAKCSSECPSQDEAKMKGEMVCGTHANIGPIASVYSECMAKCIGPDCFEIAENQDECFCKHCTQYEYNMDNFCEKPGAGRNAQGSRKDQCNEFVCTGKYKYHGRYCQHYDIKYVEKKRRKRFISFLLQ